MNLIDEAENPNTSPERLAVLATDKDYVVRRRVALNPNTPVKVLKHLATDENYAVRWSVTLNPNTPHCVKKYIKIQYRMTLINLSIRNSKYA